MNQKKKFFYVFSKTRMERKNFLIKVSYFEGKKVVTIKIVLLNL